MQDDTRRPDAAAQATPGSTPSSPPQPPQPQPPQPQPLTAESTVSPRGLEGLRSDPNIPRGFGSLGITSEPHDPLPFGTGLDTGLSYGYEHQEPMYLPLALSVGAGFKFGCGFMLALGVSVFALFLVVSVVFFVAALVGLPMPGAAP